MIYITKNTKAIVLCKTQDNRFFIKNFKLISSNKG